MGDIAETLIKIDRSQAERAAETLSCAFQSYPMIQHVFPEGTARETACRYFFGVAVRYGIHYGIVNTVTPDFEGVAVWLPPGSFPMTFGKLLRSVPFSTMVGFVRAGGGRMRDIGDFLDGIHKKAAPFRHWYLEAIGVAPEHQGKGYTSRLIRGTLGRVDEEKLPCYLDTMDPKNVRIYERFGFKVVDESQIPDTPLTTWAMLRDKQ
ncbi:MAG: GNAT family N-acetyltransferase [Dehalococcoidia bacterium]